VDNYTDTLMIERAVAIFGMLFWFAFPVGLIISVIRQDHDAHHGHPHGPSGEVDPDHESPYSSNYKKSA